MQYRLIDHTADFGIQVSGTDPCHLFENAAFALFDLTTDVTRLKGEKTDHLSIKGDDWPDLMVNWLRELLYLWSAREMFIKKAIILSISEKKLDAKILFDSFKPGFHEIKNEIKAVTYHEIQVQKLENKWIAQIIFDV